MNYSLQGSMHMIVVDATQKRWVCGYVVVISKHDPMMSESKQPVSPSSHTTISPFEPLKSQRCRAPTQKALKSLHGSSVLSPCMITSLTDHFSESCIKGHRTSSCTHTDRPRLEIKKKGRPASQCGHCRELRKTKRVHVKCMCQSQGTRRDNSPD